MAKKKGKPEPPAGRPDPKAVFEAWFKTCTADQQKTIFAVDALLSELQTDKKNLRKDLQPLRVGMELAKVKQVIVGRSGKANPQQETGRIWGAYRDSHLKDAGYSKSSCDTYVAMIEEARVILPDDTLISALLDHTNEAGVVVITGGNKEKPFGKFTMYLRSDDVQQHVKDGKVNLDDLSADDLVANVFDPDNVESPETKANMTVAVNSVVNRIFAELKTNVLPRTSKDNPLIDEAQAITHSHRLLKYVVDSLLTACACTDRLTFETRALEHLKDDEIITLSALVREANAKKTKADEAKPTKKKAKKAKSTHVREYEQQPEQQAEATEIRLGKYVVRKSTKPQFPATPWEIFEDGKDKPTARCQDRLQATDLVTRLLKKEEATPNRPSHPDAQDAIRREIETTRSLPPSQGNAG